MTKNKIEKTVREHAYDNFKELAYARDEFEFAKDAIKSIVGSYKFSNMDKNFKDALINKYVDISTTAYMVSTFL